MKPMLASDWDEKKVRFPVIAQPKIDGVRGLFITGGMTGRSLKKHKNYYTTEYFSQECFRGFDGELAAESATHPSLCRITTSAVGSYDGRPFVLWHVFDYVTEESIRLPYYRRYELLSKLCNELKNSQPFRRISLIEGIICNNMDELLKVDSGYDSQGYEGTILRDPNGLYKSGRSTVREGGLLRIKRFVDEDGVVVGVEEGETNNNEQQVNELGRTYRTSHKENKEPNGMVGRLLVKRKSGEVVTVSPGCMDHTQRRFYFENQHKILGNYIKFKHFPKGVKDKPRMAVFLSFRDESDIGD